MVFVRALQRTWWSWKALFCLKSNFWLNNQKQIELKLYLIKINFIINLVLIKLIEVKIKYSSLIEAKASLIHDALFLYSDNFINFKNFPEFMWSFLDQQRPCSCMLLSPRQFRKFLSLSRELYNHSRRSLPGTYNLRYRVRFTITL